MDRVEAGPGTFGNGWTDAAGRISGMVKSHYSLSCLNAANFKVPDRPWFLS